jgi:hypothetical protein
MEKICTAALIVFSALFFMVSCTKTNHSIYMTVSGNSTSTQIIYGSGQSLDDAMGKNSTTITVPNLPWTSQTYTVNSSSSSVFYLKECYEGNPDMNITIQIFDNGTEVQKSNCSSQNCFCQYVEYVAN